MAAPYCVVNVRKTVVLIGFFKLICPVLTQQSQSYRKTYSCLNFEREWSNSNVNSMKRSTCQSKKTIQTTQILKATSTLSRINLKTQLLPRNRIKCSPSTLIVFKLFRCPHWNAASAPERWPGNLVPGVTWLLWRQRFQKVPFSLSTLTHLAGVFKFIPFGERFQKFRFRTPKTPF